MAVDYNHYVLDLCIEHGWITTEQRSSLDALLSSNPSLAVIDVLMEQQLVSQEVVDWLRNAVAQRVATGERSLEVAEVRAPAAEIQPGLAHVADYLVLGLRSGSSDVHLGPGAPPLIRLHGRLVRMYKDAPLLTPELVEYLARDFLTADQLELMQNVGSVEFTYCVPNEARFRASVVRQRRGWEMVFRVINTKVPTLDQLGLPPILKSLTRYQHGLILVTGAVGSGKSTTMGAMIEHINHERRDHIITLEDPIEFVFTPANCQISQREVHTHTKNFATALRASLREDPDVIMIGEMRDLETISLAITASETGHLVIGTLHTSTAARTLDRLLDVFPIEQQPQIRTMVSESIRGIVCQQLIPRVDGQGRALAMEIMLNNPAVGALIREAKTFMLPGVIQTNRRWGMQLMDDSLINLLDQNLITQEDAYNRSENKKTFAIEMAKRQKNRT